MKKIFYTFLVLFQMLFIGCTDEFLKEVHPTRRSSDQFFANDQDVKEAAIGLYVYTEQLLGYNADGQLAVFDILRGDELTLPKKSLNNNVVNWLTLNYNAETGRVRDIWASSYSTIFRANAIIDNVTDNPAITETVKKQALAEAYFMRGFCYFNLTRLFNEVPLMLHQTTPETYYPEKASESECWDQVISDYQHSLDLDIAAPVSNFVDNRINKGVVNAMMARAYLLRTRPGNTKYWDKVKQYADAVEKLGVYDLEPMDNFGSIFVYTKGDKWIKNKEMIWAEANVYGPIYGGTPFMYRNSTNLGAATLAPFGKNPFIIKNDTGNSYIMGNGKGGNALYALSPQYSDVMIAYDSFGDKRTREFLYYPSYNDYKLSDPKVPTSVVLKETINSKALYDQIISTSGASGEYIHISKYRIREFIGTNIWDGGWNHGLMFPIIRYADVLLMRAEAEYNLGNAALAKTYLKKITDRAGFAANYTDQFTGQALLDEIHKQRMVELLFEGTRVSDLIRLDRFKPPYVGTYPGSAWDEKLKVLPIPQNELDLNQNLVQNNLWK